MIFTHRARPARTVADLLGVLTDMAIIIAFLAGTLNLLPRLLVAPGGDVFFHYTLISCFLEQFWQGDFYPRWCMNANAGLGAPLFLFYFPLPYYITALLYPFHALGIGITSIYLLSLWMANITTVLTCRLWLKDIVSPGRAWLGAVLLLFMPYRMELMLFRSAFAELWCIAWLPLMFLYTRRLALGDKASWIPLAGAVALGFLTHTPLTFMGVVACAGYLVCSTGWQLSPKLRFAVAMGLAGLAVGFYIVPAKYFMNDLHPEGLEFIRSVWTNRTVTIADFTEYGRAPILINFGITLLFATGLGALIMMRRDHISEATVGREIKVWLAITIAAVLVLLGTPDRRWLGDFSAIIAPWRAQAIIMFATVYLFAVKTQWLMTPKQLKTWKSDYAALMVLFVLLGLFVLEMPPPDSAKMAEQAVKEQIVSAQEYRSRWTDRQSTDPEYLIKLADRLMPSARAQAVDGQGKIEIESWDWRGITLWSDRQENGRIRLRHVYFPIWQLTLDGKKAEGLSPEAHSGFMIIEVPAGRHQIRLTRDIGAAMGWPYTLANLLSLAAVIFLALSGWRLYRKPIG